MGPSPEVEEACLPSPSRVVGAVRRNREEAGTPEALVAIPRVGRAAWMVWAGSLPLLIRVEGMGPAKEVNIRLVVATAA